MIAVAATETVGPTRLRLLTSSSARLPVVVTTAGDGGPSYYVFDLASLQSAMSTHLSATPLSEALDLAAAPAREPVAKSAAPASPAGSPVVENGRLIGVVADDLPETKEFTEADMARGGPSDDGGDSSGKRGLWKRLKRSDG